jgi:hypothetical protein
MSVFDLGRMRPGVKRLRAWAARWVTFLRTPRQGPLWHEHHDR